MQAALDELREELGSERVELGELVIRGAREKVAELRGERGDLLERRQALVEMVRSGNVLVDPAAAAEARRAWIRE